MFKTKYIIYKQFGEYKITTLKNYQNRVMNSRKIHTITDCDNFKHAQELAVKYLKLNANQIVFGGLYRMNNKNKQVKGKPLSKTQCMKLWCKAQFWKISKLFEMR